MDSGSLQSSSGGDDEFTSRAPNSLSSLFDPLQNYFIDSSPKPDFTSLMFDPFSPLPAEPTAAPITTAHSTPPQRNPRKRSRASRRAPTTVLTTDTSNFRAMVQEFTGIPAPPFSSSPFVRPRLDLYGGANPPSDVLLRPFAQKFKPPHISNSFQNQSQGLMNLRNDPMLTFQSLLNLPGGVNQGGNMPNLVSSEANLDVLHEEKGPSSQNVMEQWLCSSVNR